MSCHVFIKMAKRGLAEITARKEPSSCMSIRRDGLLGIRLRLAHLETTVSKPYLSWSTMASDQSGQKPSHGGTEYGLQLPKASIRS